MLGKNIMRNSTVLVTGASDGIGYETVKIYLENNYNVIGHYHKNPKKLSCQVQVRHRGKPIECIAHFLDDEIKYLLK